MPDLTHARKPEAKKVMLITTTRTNCDSLRSNRKLRVTCACDNCRAKKLKCDGGHPCMSCNLHEVDCTYIGSIAAKRRDPGYVTKLEKFIEHLLALHSLTGNDGVTDRSASNVSIGSSNSSFKLSHLIQSAAPQCQVMLETMLEINGQLSVDELGNCNYNGNFAGLTIQENIRRRCDVFLTGHSLVRSAEDFGPACTFRPSAWQLLEPRPQLLKPGKINLPCREAAIRLVATAFDEAFPLFQFLCKLSVMRVLDSYLPQQMNSDLEDPRSLALLYEVLALGELHSGSLVGVHAHDKSHMQRAERYFQAGQDLINMTECCDLSSVQALVCMIIYLQSSARIGTCYSYISLALTACAKMGLHQSATSRGFSGIVGESRKRVFWVLRTLETYVTTIIGLPKTFSDEEVDQNLPGELKEESAAEGTVGSELQEDAVAAAMLNSHVKLILIMDKIKKKFHNGIGAPPRRCGTFVDCSLVSELEKDLTVWFAALPPTGAYPEPISDNFEKEQLLLRLFYAHVQGVLYRPFLHHFEKNGTDLNFDINGYTCASACIHAAMQVVWVAEALKSRRYLNASYCEEAQSAAKRGYDLLIEMAKSSIAAERCVKHLEPLFKDSTVTPGLTPSAADALDLGFLGKSLNGTANTCGPILDWTF